MSDSVSTSNGVNNCSISQATKYSWWRIRWLISFLRQYSRLMMFSLRPTSILYLDEWMFTRFIMLHVLQSLCALLYPADRNNLPLFGALRDPLWTRYNCFSPWCVKSVECIREQTVRGSVKVNHEYRNLNINWIVYFITLYRASLFIHSAAVTPLLKSPANQRALCSSLKSKTKNTPTFSSGLKRIPLVWKWFQHQTVLMETYCPLACPARCSGGAHKAQTVYFS